VEGTRKLGAKLVVDESFVDFAVEGRAFTLLGEDYLRANPHLFVVKSVSKSYGVPGFRLGVLATGDETTAAAIRKALPVWNINSFGEFFLQIVDKYKADYRRACAQLAAERVRFAGALAATGLVQVYPSQANYLLCRLLGKETAGALAQRLLDGHRILIKDLSGKQGFPPGQYVRLAVRSPEENDRLTA
jgi:histidinol-phosphate/aromatic aminotransferase/cobyric acid decarboxylase-like protein